MVVEAPDGGSSSIAGAIGAAVAGVSAAAAAWFGVQVTSLEAYQKQLSTMLQDVETQLTKVNTTDGSSSFGNFSEATALYNSYQSTKQDLISQFQEVSQLIDAMVTALGKNASNYTEAETQIQSQFNSILSSYGDSPIPTTTTAPVSTASSTSSTSSGSNSSTLMGNM